jgi:serine phosphatase RsbU (regulator of sigma subunit)
MKRFHDWFIGDYLRQTEDLLLRAKIELLYYYSLSFILLGGVFYVNLWVDGLVYHTVVITFACLSLISIPFLLKLTRNVRFVANWYVIQQLLVATMMVFLDRGQETTTSAYWTILFVICVFFLYELKWALMLVVLNTILMIAISIIAIKTNLNLEPSIPALPKYSTIPFMLCVVVAFMFVRYRGKAVAAMNRQKTELELRNKEVKDSISYAERIQKAILPSQRMVEFVLPGSFVVYLPKDIVSGDFYWVEKKNNISFFAVADCTGHGVPGAMMSVICNNALNRVINEFHLTKPSEILDKLNILVEESFSKSGADIRDGMDIALCALDYTSRTVEYAGANNSLYYVTAEGMKEIKADRQPIGRFESKVPFKNHTLHLASGDAIYLFSDGIADQFGGPQGKKFKYKRVLEILKNSAAKKQNEQKNAILDGFRSWKGNLEQVDDVCLMGVRL